MREEIPGDAGALQVVPPARARKAIAETRVDELRLAIDLGELVRADDFAAAVAGAVSEFAAVLNRVAASVALAHGLPHAQKETLRKFMDTERRELVAALAKRFADG